jgi:hypothetical protein
MIAFAAAVATSHRASDAAREAASRAYASLGGAPPKLVFAFASSSYDDLDDVPAALGGAIGPLPLVGGTAAGAVFDGRGVYTRGVLVGLLGGDGVRAWTATARIRSADMLDVVPAGARVLAEAHLAASAGFPDALCFAFAPGPRVDGEALVAAVRKGTGSRMQLAGGLTGDDRGSDRARAFAEGGARADRVVLAGVFTQTAIGVAARHGCQSTGPTRIVTRSDGPWLLELDGRPALEAWLADASVAGFQAPEDGRRMLGELADRHALGLDVPSHVEPLMRAPLALRENGGVLLAASIAEGTRARVMCASPDEMLEATKWAGRLAQERAGGRSAGALVLASARRLAALGDRFRDEPEAIGRAIDAPVAGVCVMGEIARAHREVDAFHNATAVVVAWPRSRKRPVGS